MTAIEYILDGLEAELALERELGVRVVECDRSLLSAAPADCRAANPKAAVSSANGQASLDQCGAHTSSDRLRGSLRSGDTGDRALPSVQRPVLNSSTQAISCSFAFLHHAPLSPDGAEMVAKISAALEAAPGSAPVAVAPPLPDARIYVVLGGLALKKWFPGQNAAPGQWLKSANGADVLVTYSPEFILRFKSVAPTMKKLKFDMWTSLKEMKRRLQQ